MTRSRPLLVAALILVGCSASNAPAESGPDDAGIEAALDGAAEAAPDAGPDGDLPDAGLDGPLDAADAADPADAAAPDTKNIIATEQAAGRIVVLDTTKDWSTSDAVVWSWKPEDSPEIKSSDYGWFGNLSDAKPVNDEKDLLLAASGGGIALIRTSDKAARFYARAEGNTHSIELLPDGTVVSASSSGSYLRAYSRAAGKPQLPATAFNQIPLADAHGLAWDLGAELLWAIGASELAAFEYDGNPNDPHLKKVATHSLPTTGGHDLYPLYGTKKLLLTTNSKAYVFDTQAKEFAPFAPLPSQGGMKALSVNPATGQFAYTVPIESWWTDSVTFLEPKAKKTRPNAHFYKARWWAPCPFSYGP